MARYSLRDRRIVRSQRDFANLLGINEATISRALKGDEKYLTYNLVSKVQDLIQTGQSAVPVDAVTMFPALDGEVKRDDAQTLLVIPTDAVAGTLGEFADSVSAYECERMTSPIKGAEFAMKVCGESMSPEIPNGSQILIKKIQEEQFIEWGKIFCLDTMNGAVIKKVFPTNDPQVIECRSVNPDFPPFTINTKYINGWYRVLMVMCLK